MTNNVESTQPSTSRAVHAVAKPRRGNHRFSLNVNNSPAEGTQVNGSLKELLRTTWTVFAVSTLFNFHKDQLHLKQYSKRLREEVASNWTQENVVYNAKFSIVNDMTLNSSDSAMKVEVHSKNSAVEEDPGKCVYRGILLSWENSVQKLATPNAARLPLLLCRGTKVALRIVHHVLTRIFDCLIIALPIEEDDLMWLVPILVFPTGEHHSKGTDEACMEYRIPELPDTDTITIKLKVSDVIKISKAIIDADGSETDTEVTFTLEHIEKFRDVLYTEMLAASSLQLGFCTLHKISLAGLTMMGNKMKLMNVEAANRVLLYMNDKAYDILHAMDNGI